MTEKGLSLPEFTALVVLAVEAGEVSNPQLGERWGLKIDGAKRLRLNELKLVDSWKKGRSFVHTLTDSGWARLAEDLHTGTLPAFTGSSGVMARALFTWLPAFLSRTDQRLSDLFQPGDSSEVQAGRSSGEAPQEHQVEDRIRSAYAELAARPGAWVKLARLRTFLGDLPKAQIDEALVRMERLEDVSIIPESNQKALTQEDREAAVVIGNQDKHVLWIGTI
ncbi:hypothetical protein [Nonomuraea sp. NPDC046570]|uniref:hypothetical protein n=1 Tax=Nonomuraea sp. NPDC046570 TaxID=3155255 RepID=UPI0033F3A7A2